MAKNNLKDYKFRQIKNRQQLIKIFSQGLDDLYIKVFSQEPYDEKYSPDSVHDLFLKIFNLNGDIFIAEIDRKVVGFAAGFALSSGIYWFEELGTDPNHRKKGVGKHLVKLLIEKVKSTKSFSYIELTTNKNNDPAISLYKKFNFKISSHVFVPSYKTGQRIDLDERVVMRKKIGTYSSYVPFLERVSILNPSGNVTALVFDKVPQKKYVKYSNIIFQTIPDVEQVGFVKKSESGRIKLEMMGLEFSGNAIRCLGRYILRPPIFKIKVESSGIDTPIELIRSKYLDNIKAKIPLDASNMNKFDDSSYLVDLNGISHLIVPGKKPSKILAKKYLKMIKKDSKYSSLATGIIFVKNKHRYRRLRIDPYVYVEKTKTLFYEQACGSGSIAAAIWAFHKKLKGQIQDFEIIQPSRAKFNISIYPSFAYIDSDVTHLKTGQILRIKEKDKYLFEKNLIYSIIYNN